MSHYTCLARLLCGACMHACCVVECVCVGVCSRQCIFNWGLDLFVML